MNILVCNAQIPYARGGAEDQAEGLVKALCAYGHRAEIVQLPFRWQPIGEILKSAFVWRMLDLTEANGVRVDRIITTKFPSYAARHPHKIVWLVHQFRQAYDWFGTPRSAFSGATLDRKIRAQIIEMDRRTLSEAQGLYTTSKNNAARLQRFSGLHAKQLYAPPRLANRLRSAEPGDYILSVGRLDQAKRVDLLLRALAQAPAARAIIVGAGHEMEALQKLAQTLGIASRAQFPGLVDDATLIDLYARARAVFYGPLDEDYGLVTVEAFMAARPVITTDDAGGVLEFVEQDCTGLVSAPEPAAIAQNIARVYADGARAKAWGEAGRARVAGITWERVVAHLTA